MKQTTPPVRKPVTKLVEPVPAVTQTDKTVIKQAETPKTKNPPLESFPKVGYCSECGEPAYDTPSGSVCKNHHGGAPVLDEPPAKQKPAEKQMEASKPAAKKLEFDYSSIDPEKEWECFGTIDKNHSECKECPFAERCEEKKNSKSK